MNMIILASGLGISALAALAMGWVSATRIDIHTEIEIAAPPEAVWSVLADNERYGDWNPYHVRADGKLREGEKLDLELHKPDGSTVSIQPHVMTVAPHHLLVWGGGITGVFKGVHTFELSRSASGCTKLVQKESFAGLFVRFASLDGIEEGYNSMNRALKDHVERLQAADEPLRACA